MFFLDASGISVTDNVLNLLWSWELFAACVADWIIAPSHSDLSLMAADLGIAQIMANWHCVCHLRPLITNYDRNVARARLSASQRGLRDN
ncbi:hypothetical protein [Nitrosomonas sp. Is79A3]|uniref:hypothetical protein n=1 Tax=Nitrosomonas sp. (strain Is79A3) TaxID=261292 RepID=UPI0012EA8B9E